MKVKCRFWVDVIARVLAGRQQQIFRIDNPVEKLRTVNGTVSMWSEYWCIDTRQIGVTPLTPSRSEANIETS